MKSETQEAVARDLQKSRSKARSEWFQNEFRFQCRSRKLPAFETEYPFAEDCGRKFRADLAFLKHRVLVEIQGGIFMPRGAHGMPTKIRDDIRRAQYAALLGWTLLPITTDEVRDLTGVATLVRVLHAIEQRGKE